MFGCKSSICSSNNIKGLAELSAPIIVTALIQEACQISTLVYVGRLKNAEFIGAATLGNMVCNITGFSLAFGMCSVLDTLTSQAFGAKQYRLLGLYTQRAIAILTLACLPVLLFWNQTEFILKNILRIPALEAQLAGLWSRILCLGLWPSVCFEILRKFLQGQNIVWPVVIATCCGTLFNICCNYYLIFYKDWGFQGAAFTVPLTNWFQFTILACVIIIRKAYLKHQQLTSEYTLVSMNQDSSLDDSMHDGIALNSLGRDGNMKEIDRDLEEFSLAEPELDPEDNWPPLSTKIFEDWPQFLKLGIPGAISLFIEWGSYELAAGIAGQLGSVPLAAHGIFGCTAGIFYMVPQAVALSVATLVGNFLGAREFKEARDMVNLGITIDFSYGLFAGFLLMFCLRNIWGPAFSNNTDVQQAIYETMPMMAIYSVLDAMKCISLNILRSTGRPNVTVIVNTFVCLTVMLPLGYYMGVMQHFGLAGIWGSMTFAWFLAALAYFIVLYRTDWSQQVIIPKA